MKSNGSIIVQIGKKQSLMKDRETYPSSVCKDIESIIMYDLPELSKEGVSARMRFNDAEGNSIVQITLEEGISKMSDESKAIALITGLGGKLKLSAYTGNDCDGNCYFDKEEYSLSSIDSYISALKSFYSSFKVEKGSLGVVVIIVGNYDVFMKIRKDEFFANCYILYSCD